MKISMTTNRKGLLLIGYREDKSKKSYQVTLEHGTNLDDLLNKIDRNIVESRNPVAREIWKDLMQSVLGEKKDGR